MGVAILAIKYDELELKWSNPLFNNMFDCEKSCDNLRLKIFKDYVVHSKSRQRIWSITDILTEIHSKFNRMNGIEVIRKLLEINPISMDD
jgi:hypothetical protein